MRMYARVRTGLPAVAAASALIALPKHHDVNLYTAITPITPLGRIPALPNSYVHPAVIGAS